MVMSMESTSNMVATTSSKEGDSECEQNRHQIWLTASKHSVNEKDIKNYTYHFLWIKHKSRELKTKKVQSLDTSHTFKKKYRPEIFFDYGVELKQGYCFSFSSLG